VCSCAHGPGGAAAPLRDARGAPVPTAELSRNAQALWALWQAPSAAFDDADGVSVLAPPKPRAAPPLLDESGAPALQVRACAAARRAGRTGVCAHSAAALLARCAAAAACAAWRTRIAALFVSNHANNAARARRRPPPPRRRAG
jgi:hypothetical protein